MPIAESILGNISSVEPEVAQPPLPRRTTLRRLMVIPLLTILDTLGGCATHSGDKAPTKPRELWPSPPDLPKYLHVATLRRASDIERPSREQLLRKQLTGEVDTSSPAFQKPGSLIARQGRLYITDTVSRQIVVFDLPRSKVFRFGHRNPGKLVKPSGLALDGKSNIYVADTTPRVVQVFDHLGMHLKTLGDDQDLERPVGVAVNTEGTRIYVVDRASNENNRHRVVIYDADNKKIGEIGGRGAEPGKFNVPLAAAMGPNNTLHVLDAGNFRVQVFDAEGRFLRSIGELGGSMGNFARPRGLAVDDEGNVYVTDASFGNFQIFNAAGELLLPIGQITRVDTPGQYALISGIAVDELRHVYVADQYFNKVEVFRRLDEAEAKRFLESGN